MAKFLFKRILLFVPTLLVITILTFFLSRSAPGDPVEQALTMDNIAMDDAEYELLYQQEARSMGLDMPVFYFKIRSAAYPDTLYKIIPKSHQNNLSRLISRYGNWEEIQAYYYAIKAFKRQLKILPDSLAGVQKPAFLSAAKKLLLNYKEKKIEHHLRVIRDSLVANPNLPKDFQFSVQQLEQAHRQMISDTHPMKLKIPAISWYGSNNQYHQWLRNLLSGNLGISLVDGRPVSNKITDALKWTLLINGIAILLAYLISIFIGVYTAVRKGTKRDRLSSLFLFMMHSLPNFWVAILLIIFFTNPEFGMDWFPAMGIGDLSGDASFWEVVRVRSHHLALPILCLTYPSLAFISRQMRGAMVGVLDKDYIRTARAKGVPQQKIVWKHAFRNSLFPIITLFASIFPAAISGSIVIEQIFSIPGMGRLMIESINQQDWPVVFGILILAAILTILGILVADILYSLADPRVKISEKQ